MIKYARLIAVFVFVVILGGCNKANNKEDTLIPLPNMNNEDGIKENLIEEDLIKNQIFKIFTNDIDEIQEYIDLGFEILYTDETTIINGEKCYLVFLGTNHEENFVREIHCAVNIDLEKVYKYDVLTDFWEVISGGENPYSPDLTTEAAMKEYLMGDWFSSIEYLSNIVVKMSINKELKVDLSFSDSYSGESKGDYKGEIKFDRIYAKPNEVPDLISLKLSDENYSEADFFFLNRTVYDGKRVMSWFFSGNGSCIFNKLSDMEDYEYIPGEIMFEKLIGDVPQYPPRKNDYFYAVFWGHGAEDNSIWLDDVWWEEAEEGSLQLYPPQMTLYDTDIQASVLYKIADNRELEILNDGMSKGEVYFIETNKDGRIIEIINAEYKAYIEKGLNGYYDTEVEEFVFDIIKNYVEEIKEYLNEGMTIWFNGEIDIIDNDECYLVALGRYHGHHFEQEIFYAVSINTQIVYRYDDIEHVWKQVVMG